MLFYTCVYYLHKLRIQIILNIYVNKSLLNVLGTYLILFLINLTNSILSSDFFELIFFNGFVSYIDWLIITFGTPDVWFLSFLFFRLTFFFKPLPLNMTQGENVFGKTSIKFILIFGELESSKPLEMYKNIRLL